MDNNDRRQRQTPSGYASQQGTLLQPQSAQYPVVSASDRFRQQAPLTAQPPTSVPSGTRASSQSYGYAYDQGSQFVGSSIQPPYGAQDYAAAAADQQQQPQRTSQYSQYGQNVMYNVPAAQASTANQSQYEPVQQYQQSRDPAIEALNTGFGVAQTQYYGVPGQEGPTSGSASALASQSVPSQYSSLGYTAQSAPVGRESLAPAYSTAGMTDPHQATSQGGYPHPGYGEQSGSGSGNDYDDFYNNYQNELKKTNEETREGRLSESAARLFRMSDWLLHWAETLGLVRDDENHYQQRLDLWEEFNNCWLTTLQKELIMLEEYRTSRQRPPAPQSWIEPGYLEKMGNQLVKNCDLMEKHGLVDYQMGVWEEEITAMLIKCLDLCEKAGLATSTQRPHAASSSRSR